MNRFTSLVIVGVWMALGGAAYAETPTAADLRAEAKALAAKLPLSTEEGNCEKVKSEAQVLSEGLKALDEKAASLAVDETGYLAAARQKIANCFDYLSWDRWLAADCMGRLNRANILLEGEFMHLDVELMLYQSEANGR